MSTPRGRNFLMAPGPTNIPERVLRAMQRPAMELSVPEFVRVTRSCIEDLKPIFKTRGEVFIYPANGHGAWEASLANTLSPGDKVLLPHTGLFSTAWGRTAQALGVEIEPLPGDGRHAVAAEAVEERLRADEGHEIAAVLLVHTDTATGITSDVAAVGRAIVAARHPALFMVDAIASLVATEFEMDEWGVDVALGASQKALMSPPGLSFNAVSEKGLAASERRPRRSPYWDWQKRISPHWYDWYCGTPPAHSLFALREAIDMVMEEGLTAAIARHRRLARGVQAAVERWAAGGVLELNALREGERSNSVSTVRVAEPYRAPEIQRLCRERFNVSVAGGLGELDGKSFRIGHLGDINEPMVLGALASIEAVLKCASVPHGADGVAAAIEVYAAD